MACMLSWQGLRILVFLPHVGVVRWRKVVERGVQQPPRYIYEGGQIVSNEDDILQEPRERKLTGPIHHIQ